MIFGWFMIVFCKYNQNNLIFKYFPRLWTVFCWVSINFGKYNLSVTILEKCGENHWFRLGKMWKTGLKTLGKMWKITLEIHGKMWDFFKKHLEKCGKGVIFVPSNCFI